MDSSTLLAAIATGYIQPGEPGVDMVAHVEALSIHYGQRHKRELSSAVDIAQFYDVPHHKMNISSVFENMVGDSALTNPDVPVPEGHYADENMKQTVVPNRNMILNSLAVGFAIANGFDTVAYAAHAGDHTIYPDCRKDFIGQLSRAIALCDWNPPSLYAPFADIDKTDIAAIGNEIGVPYEVTWTCYKGGEDPCGVCGSCVERNEAFDEFKTRDIASIYSRLLPWPTSRPLSA
jgi:7-cyano-7-deazaguanine synthase